MATTNIFTDLQITQYDNNTMRMVVWVTGFSGFLGIANNTYAELWHCFFFWSLLRILVAIKFVAIQTQKLLLILLLSQLTSTIDIITCVNSYWEWIGRCRRHSLREGNASTNFWLNWVPLGTEDLNYFLLSDSFFILWAKLLFSFLFHFLSICTQKK